MRLANRAPATARGWAAASRFALCTLLVAAVAGAAAGAAQQATVTPVAEAATAEAAPTEAPQAQPPALHAHPPVAASPPAAEAPAVEQETPEALPREPAPPEASPAAAAGAGWPSPVADDGRYSNLLLDLLEVQRVGSVDAMRWDLVGWWGGDWRRLWLKSEANLYRGRDSGGQWDVQALYGKLISPFFDLQLGLRVEQHMETDSDPTRAFAVLGLQGLAPYGIEVEPALFLSNKGKLSGRLTASRDTLLTQRLILQSRFETEVAAQRDEEFGVESGVNDAELGLRLRYEVRRELAPYVGLSYRRSLGAARQRVRREGGDPNELQVAVGLRTWF